TIRAIRSQKENNSIFVIAMSMKFGEGNKTEKRLLLGVACYAYDDPTKRFMDYLGLKEGDFDDSYITNCYSGKDECEYTMFETYAKNGEELIPLNKYKIPAEIAEELDSKFVGVPKETFEEFIEWLKENLHDFIRREEAKELIKKIQGNKKRVNQGDTYIASKLGIETPTSDIGKQEEPLMIQMMKG
ncbi:hypothetical protein M0R36_11015, partial [bacterium]|nr:hypothetical protein [bacterium]